MKKVTAHIGQHQFTLSCTNDNEAAAIEQAVRHLNQRIEQARRKSGVTDGERGALMAALSMALEKGKSDNIEQAAVLPKEIEETARKLSQQIDNVLARTDSTVSPRRRRLNSVNQ